MRTSPRRLVAGAGVMMVLVAGAAVATAAPVGGQRAMTMTWTDGKRYVGGWRETPPHGQGVMTWPDSTRYVGEWREGKPHGFGVYKWPDGTRYVGEWREGVRHGQGSMSWPDGFCYEGVYLDGKPHGYGAVTTPDGGRFEGASMGQIMALGVDVGFPIGDRKEDELLSACAAAEQALEALERDVRKFIEGEPPGG